MPKASHLSTRRGVLLGVGLVSMIAVLVLFSGPVEQAEFLVASQGASGRPTGGPQLVSVEPLPVMDGEMCEWEPASASMSLRSAFRQERSAMRAPAEGGQTRTAIAFSPRK